MEINSIIGLQEIYQKQHKDFTFNFDKFSVSENENWDKLIKKDYFACGCDTGTLFLLLTIFSILIYTFWLYTNSVSLLDIDLGIKFIAYLFLAGLLGKGTGLAIAKFRLRSNLKKIEQLLLS